MRGATRRPRALVLGCGPAGAACALALASSDWDVEIARAESDAPGFGWLLMPNGVEALRALDALDRAIEGVREIRRATIVDPKGDRAEEGMAQTYCGSRAALVDALVETRRARGGQTEETETAGAATVSMKDETVTSVDIQREDGTVVTRRFQEDFDLVVGADGVHSTTYAALNGASSSRRNVGGGRCHTVITAGDSAALAEALRGRFVKRYFCTPARGSRPRRCCAMGLLGVSATRVLGFLQFDTHTHGEAPRVSRDGPKAMLAFFESALGVDRWLTDFGEDDETLSLIRRYLTQCADVETYRPHVWRPVEAGVAERLVGTNVALVGDAAHPMADFTSQGVSSALEDAVCLAKHVKHYTAEGAMTALLQKYADERRGVVERYIAAGERLRNDFVQLPDGVTLARPFTRSGSVRLVNRRGVGISDLLLVGLVVRRFQRNLDRKTDANMLPSISLGDDEEKWERSFDDRWGVGWEHEHRGRLAEKERNDAINLPKLRERAFNYRWATLPSEVIPLTAASTDFPAPKCVVEAIQSYAASGIFTYGPNEGIPEFRTAVAKYFTTRLRRGGADPDVAVGGAREITSEVVMAANAAAAAIYAVTAALVSPGDEVLVMDPVDFLLSTSVKAMGGKIVRYSVLDTRASSTADDVIARLEKLVTPRSKVLSICNPHNPLGIAWRASELVALAEFAEKHSLTILSDEVWCDLVHAPRTHVPTACVSACAAARTYTILGFSKSHGLEGLRVGAVVAPSREALASCSAASATDVTANGCSTLSQIAAIAAMEHASDFDEGWLAEWRAHVRWCVSYAVYRLNSIPGVRATLPEACSIVFADVSTILSRLGPEDETEPERVFCDWLISSNSGVAVVPGLEQFFGPAARGRVRLAVATSPELLAKALDRFERACERFRVVPSSKSKD